LLFNDEYNVQNNPNEVKGKDFFVVRFSAIRTNMTYKVISPAPERRTQPDPGEQGTGGPEFREHSSSIVLVVVGSAPNRDAFNMKQDEMIATLARYKGELEGILSRFKKTHDGIHIDEKDDARFRELALELRDLFDDAFVDGQRHSNPVVSYYNESISNYIGSPSHYGVESVKGVVTSALTRVQRNPLALKKAALEAKSNSAKNPDVVVMLAERLHAVVRQLRERREKRPTLDVTDEYDVQDLLHALLRIHFDDIRKEEWTPSYAGGASRMDFLLPEIETVVETKMTWTSQNTNSIPRATRCSAWSMTRTDELPIPAGWRTTSKRIEIRWS
jgi:hypothetical protein